ncbi:MAG: M48 family metallopeptidase [Rhodospirillaceae bacterium]
MKSAGFDVELEIAAALPDDLAARVVITHSARARRLSLRLDPARRQIVLVRPRRASNGATLKFVASREGWIRKHLAMLPPPIAFADGARIPIAGVEHTLQFVPQARGGVWREGEAILISGQPEFAARRMTDWLKDEARRVLVPMVTTMAETIACKVKQVSTRDTTSRWGSCSPDGRLSFSWRLVLAPLPALIYVAAHEVSHLRHLNHGRAFWRTVDEVLDKYIGDAETRREAGLARDWLRRNGAGLHRYG